MPGASTSTYAVDLFADVLVRTDGVTYRVCDLDDFEQTRRRELISPGEADGAGRGLAELTAITERGGLLAFLSRTCPVTPLDPPAASPARRVPSRRFRCSVPKAGPPGPGGAAAGLPQHDAAHAVTGGSGLRTDLPWCYRAPGTWIRAHGPV